MEIQNYEIIKLYIYDISRLNMLLQFEEEDVVSNCKCVKKVFFHFHTANYI